MLNRSAFTPGVGLGLFCVCAYIQAIAENVVTSPDAAGSTTSQAWVSMMSGLTLASANRLHGVSSWRRSRYSYTRERSRYKRPANHKITTIRRMSPRPPLG